MSPGIPWKMMDMAINPCASPVFWIGIVFLIGYFPRITDYQIHADLVRITTYDHLEFEKLVKQFDSKGDRLIMDIENGNSSRTLYLGKEMCESIGIKYEEMSNFCARYPYTSIEYEKIGANQTHIKYHFSCAEFRGATRKTFELASSDSDAETNIMLVQTANATDIRMIVDTTRTQWEMDMLLICVTITPVFYFIRAIIMYNYYYDYSDDELEELSIDAMYQRHGLLRWWQFRNGQGPNDAVTLRSKNGEERTIGSFVKGRLDRDRSKSVSRRYN